jgi:hypothetical protein
MLCRRIPTWRRDGRIHCFIPFVPTPFPLNQSTTPQRSNPSYHQQCLRERCRPPCQVSSYLLLPPTPRPQDHSNRPPFPPPPKSSLKPPPASELELARCVLAANAGGQIRLWGLMGRADEGGHLVDEGCCGGV